MKRNFAPKAQNSRIQYKVFQNSRNFNKSSTEEATPDFRRFTNASKHRDQCLLALSYFNIDFQEILKISVFFEIRKTEPFPGSPFSDHFWRLFFEKFCIALFLGKILVANYRIVCEFDRHTEKCRHRRRPRGQAGATLALRVLSSSSS